MAARVREVDAGRSQQYNAWASHAESRMDDFKSRVYIALEYETEAIARAKRTNDELAEQLQYAYQQHEGLTQYVGHSRRAEAAYW